MESTDACFEVACKIMSFSKEVVVVLTASPSPCLASSVLMFLIMRCRAKTRSPQHAPSVKPSPLPKCWKRMLLLHSTLSPTVLLARQVYVLQCCVMMFLEDSILKSEGLACMHVIQSPYRSPARLGSFVSARLLFQTTMKNHCRTLTLYDLPWNGDLDLGTLRWTFEMFQVFFEF
jgi:hypothetical protein